MKIVFLTGKLNTSDGVTTYLFHLIKNLSNRHKIYLLCSRGDALPLFDFPNFKFQIIDELSFDKRSYWNFLTAAIKISAVAMRFKPDIIHSNNHYTANIVYYSRKISGRRKLHVQTVHSDFKNEGKLAKFRGDELICVNKQLLEAVREENLVGFKKAHLIYNGIEFDKELRKRLKEERAKTKIVAAGRIVEEKGFQILLEAISLLSDSNKEKIDLSLFGEGCYFTRLKELANELKINVSFKGNELIKSKIYSDADIFVFPSLIDWFGLTILEAANYFNFIIASDFKGIENIIEDENDGFIYDRFSANDLSKKILKAIELGRKKRMDIAANFRNKAVQKFSADRMALETEKVYLQN